jgi:hypothetical protein
MKAAAALKALLEANLLAEGPCMCPLCSTPQVEDCLCRECKHKVRVMLFRNKVRKLKAKLR